MKGATRKRIISFRVMSSFGRGRGPKRPKSDVLARVKVRRAQEAALRPKGVSKVSNGVRQLTVQKMFGKTLSPFQIWLRNGEGQIFREQLRNKALSDKDRGKILGDARAVYIQRYGDSGGKISTSMRGLKNFFKRNGVHTVTKRLLHMLRMYDGTSSEQFLAWHKQKFGKLESISDPEVYMYMEQQVAPYLTEAVRRKENQSKAILKYDGPASTNLELPASSMKPIWSDSSYIGKKDKQIHTVRHVAGQTQRFVPRIKKDGSNTIQNLNRPIRDSRPYGDPSSLYDDQTLMSQYAAERRNKRLKRSPLQEEPSFNPTKFEPKSDSESDIDEDQPKRGVKRQNITRTTRQNTRTK